MTYLTYSIDTYHAQPRDENWIPSFNEWHVSYDALLDSFFEDMPYLQLPLDY